MPPRTLHSPPRSQPTTPPSRPRPQEPNPRQYDPLRSSRHPGTNRKLLQAFRDFSRLTGHGLRRIQGHIAPRCPTHAWTPKTFFFRDETVPSSVSRTAEDTPSPAQLTPSRLPSSKHRPGANQVSQQVSPGQRNPKPARTTRSAAHSARDCPESSFMLSET